MTTHITDWHVCPICNVVSTKHELLSYNLDTYNKKAVMACPVCFKISAARDWDLSEDDR